MPCFLFWFDFWFFLVINLKGTEINCIVFSSLKHGINDLCIRNQYAVSNFPFNQIGVYRIVVFYGYIGYAKLLFSFFILICFYISNTFDSGVQYHCDIKCKETIYCIIIYYVFWMYIAVLVLCIVKKSFIRKYMVSLLNDFLFCFHFDVILILNIFMCFDNVCNKKGWKTSTWCILLEINLLESAKAVWTTKWCWKQELCRFQLSSCRNNELEIF